MAEPLTKREQEVLQHASAMLSTAGAASQRYMSNTTVKAHLNSIYRKLAATHRGEAVRKALQLALIRSQRKRVLGSQEETADECATSGPGWPRTLVAGL